MASFAQKITLNFSNFSCIKKIKESKWLDIALIATGVALSVIGVLASIGILNAMGAANALILSYAMYGGAALLFLIEIIKFSLHQCSKRSQNSEKSQNPNPTQNSTSPEKPVIIKQNGSSSAPLQFSQIGQEILKYVKALLKKRSLEEQSPLQRCNFVKGEDQGAPGVTLKQQPCNEEIAFLWNLHKEYFKTIQGLCRESLGHPWDNNDILQEVDKYIKICHAISCLTLCDVAKNKRGTFESALMSKDADCYATQTFALIYEEFISLKNGSFWKRAIDAQFAQTPKGLAYHNTFYQEGSLQNRWRILSNDFCSYLSLYTSVEALYAAGSDELGPHFKERAYIYYFHEDKTETKFSEDLYF